MCKWPVMTELTFHDHLLGRSISPKLAVGHHICCFGRTEDTFGYLLESMSLKRKMGFLCKWPLIRELTFFDHLWGRFDFSITSRGAPYCSFGRTEDTLGYLSESMPLKRNMGFLCKWPRITELMFFDHLWGRSVSP